MPETHEPIVITYRFRREGEELQEIRVAIDRETLRSEPLSQPPYPDWVRLEFQQCAGCRWQESANCPVAERLVAPVEASLDVISFAEVDVEVETEERTYCHRLDMQEGLRSLFGLLMATSGCPSLSGFRPMARHHMPFSTFDETFFRITGVALMQQLFEKDAATRAETIARLNGIYADAAMVNAGVMERLRNGVEAMADSSPNAVALLAAFSGLVPLTAEKKLAEVEKLFQASAG